MRHLALALSLTACSATGMFSTGSTTTPSSTPPAVAVADEPAPSRAGRLDDFSEALLDYTSDEVAALVNARVVQYHVGPACRQRMLAEDSGALHTASYVTRYIIAYAQKVTGEDWSAIANQVKDAGRRRQLLEEQLEAFASRFSLTVVVEGDDCDASRDAPWLRYLYTAANGINDYPYRGGLAVEIEARASVKDAEIDVHDDDTDLLSVRIVMPLEVMPKDWFNKIEKPFRTRARG